MERWERVRAQPALRGAEVVQRFVSYSNDTLLLEHPRHGRCVLRICWRGRRERLTTEALLAAELPPEVGYPSLLDHGRVDDLPWMLTQFLPGCPLADVWDELDESARDRAAADLAERLAALYSHRPSPAVAQALVGFLNDTDLVGSAITALPRARLEHLLARGVPGLDEPTADALHDWLAARPGLDVAVDDPSTPVNHGDLHPANIWWDGQRVSGVIDLEWARFGPAWADLGRLGDVALSDLAEGRPGAGPALVRRLDPLVPAFGESTEDERLFAILASLVRQACVWPAEDADSLAHPLLLVRQLLQPQHDTLLGFAGVVPG